MKAKVTSGSVCVFGGSESRLDPQVIRGIFFNSAMDWMCAKDPDCIMG